MCLVARWSLGCDPVACEKFKGRIQMGSSMNPHLYLLRSPLVFFACPSTALPFPSSLPLFPCTPLDSLVRSLYGNEGGCPKYTSFHTMMLNMVGRHSTSTRNCCKKSLAATWGDLNIVHNWFATPSIFGVPRNCQGLCLRKGKINAMIRGLCMFGDQSGWVGSTVNTRSTTFYKAFNHKVVISLGTTITCVDLLRLVQEIRNFSMATSPVHGGGTHR